MKNILQNGRKVMSVLLVVFLFLPWLRYEASGGGVTAGVSFSGFTMIGQFFVSLLLFVMPAAIIVAMFLPEKIKNIKALYMVCPPIGIVIAVLIGIIAPLYLKSGVDVSGVSEKCIWGIGLWLTIVDYVLIFVSTIAIELNITKDSLKGDGFKNVAKQSLDAVKNSAKELASKE